MAPASYIVMQNAIKNANLKADGHNITNAEYSGADTRKWKHYIVAATKTVTHKAEGAAGDHSHTYLVETKVHFNEQPGANPNPAGNPGHFVFTTGIAAKLQSITMSQ